ncbi:MAG: ECF transporter S component [Clostridiales bacterium]|jgi:uncharacterized membrane protein|nr:ECF transporter S component [Clostridiales bacterium]
MRSAATRKLTVMGMFSAIIILLIFTPIGFINLPFIKATIVHVPVIIGAVILGPKYGAALGFLFGAGSLISNTFIPSGLSFAFSPAITVPGTDSGSPLSLIICFVPRILVGVIPWFAYTGLCKLPIKQFKVTNTIWLAVTGVVGAFTNTLLVMPLIYLIFKEPFALYRGISTGAVLGVVMGIIGSNGLMEAIAAAVLTAAIAGVLQLVIKGEK